jgi:hypothetical protein
VKRLVLYSRPGCHLCDELAAEIAPLIEGRAHLEIVDISQDDDLMRRYGLRIPVLSGSDGEVSGFPLDRRRLIAYVGHG